LVDQEDGVGSGRDGCGDLGEVQVHRLGVAGRHDQVVRHRSLRLVNTLVEPSQVKSLAFGSPDTLARSILWARQAVVHPRICYQPETKNCTTPFLNALKVKLASPPIGQQRIAHQSRLHIYHIVRFAHASRPLCARRYATFARASGDRFLEALIR
jgi:hypothetical protein